jgi:hypothetical protein
MENLNRNKSVTMEDIDKMNSMTSDEAIIKSHMRMWQSQRLKEMSQDFNVMRGSAGLIGQMGTMQTMNHAKMTKDIVDTIVVTQGEMSKIGRQAVATQVEVMKLRNQLPQQPMQQQQPISQRQPIQQQQPVQQQQPRQQQKSQEDIWKEEIRLKIKRNEHLLLPYKAIGARRFIHPKNTIDLMDTDDIIDVVRKFNSYLGTSLSSLEEIAEYAIATKRDMIVMVHEDDYENREFEYYGELRAVRQKLGSMGVKCPIIVFSNRKGWSYHDACYNC